MRELLWAIVALVILLTLTLIALGLRFQSLNKTGLTVSNIFEDGLLFGIFAILFAPIYLAWMGAQSIWVRNHPPAALATDPNDPVWGRNVNREVVKTAFLAVQEARMKANPNLAKRFISSEVYQQLRRECGHGPASHENWSQQTVNIRDIVFTDERIEKDHALCYFNAVVSGTISRVSGEDGPRAASHAALEEPEEFEQHLEFARALPEVRDARWQLMTISRR